MYAHLLNMKAPLNSLVSRGETIGSVGTSNNFYPAHLHFEIRNSDGIDIGAGYAMTPLNRLDPTKTIEAYHDSSANGISPSFLKITNRLNDSAWTGMEIENADKLFEQKSDLSEETERSLDEVDR
jgi:murein DD-endopeptidase MepM/ murein hydrolase activator NlpD